MSYPKSRSISLSPFLHKSSDLELIQRYCTVFNLCCSVVGRHCGDKYYINMSVGLDDLQFKCLVHCQMMQERLITTNSTLEQVSIACLDLGITSVIVTLLGDLKHPEILPFSLISNLNPKQWTLLSIKNYSTTMLDRFQQNKVANNKQTSIIKFTGSCLLWIISK